MAHNVSLINNGFLVVAGVLTATSALPLKLIEHRFRGDG
jgi:hypothetical protein